MTLELPPQLNASTPQSGAVLSHTGPTLYWTLRVLLSAKIYMDLAAKRTRLLTYG